MTEPVEHVSESGAVVVVPGEPLPDLRQVGEVIHAILTEHRPWARLFTQPAPESLAPGIPGWAEVLAGFDAAKAACDADCDAAESIVFPAEEPEPVADLTAATALMNTMAAAQEFAAHIDEVASAADAADKAAAEEKAVPDPRAHLAQWAPAAPAAEPAAADTTTDTTTGETR